MSDLAMKIFLKPDIQKRDIKTAWNRHSRKLKTAVKISQITCVSYVPTRAVGIFKPQLKCGRPDRSWIQGKNNDPQTSKLNKAQFHFLAGI